MKKINKFSFFASLFVFCLLLILPLYSQSSSAIAGQKTAPTALDRGIAAEEFRRGVQAYYRGTFNDSLVQFEKSLSYLPQENLILDWLGKAYYRSGIEGAALQQWQTALKSGYGGLLLQNRIEIVQTRRITGDDREKTVRFTEAGIFPGQSGEVFHFSQPLSILPMDDGSVWVSAYGSNEILKLDVNGQIITRSRGPITGFDRPMDILRQKEGTFLVSEYAGDRLSQLDERGGFIQYFGKKGRKTGELLGPQYMAEDSSGNIYVSDYGNGRITVFSAAGVGLFSFGKFKSPSGIAIKDDIVYIADSSAGNISMYDTAGNYLDVLTETGTLVKPEALRVWNDHLIAADTNRVLIIDTKNGSLREAGTTGNAPVRLTCADIDKNGNILAADFKNSEVFILSPMTELVGGLFVQVERVNADKFPQVVLEVRVENRQRQPILGLKDINFLISEEKRPAAQQKLIGSGHTNTICDISIIIDRSSDTALYNQALDNAVREIAASMKGQGVLSIISAGQVPLLEYKGGPAAMEKFSSANIKTPPSPLCAIDLGIRLGANGLINGEKKRALVYLTAGTSNPRAFAKYSLTDLTAYLNNNAIPFLTVNLSRQTLASEIAYISRQTSGGEYYVFRPEGLSFLVKDILAIPVGLYQFSYVSSLPTDFGRAFLPVEVEAYIMNRSGRDETGYFAPLN